MVVHAPTMSCQADASAYWQRMALPLHVPDVPVRVVLVQADTSVVAPSEYPQSVRVLEPVSQVQEDAGNQAVHVAP